MEPINIDEKGLETIRDLAGLFFTEKEVAAMMELDQRYFLSEMRNPSSAIARAYNSGWLQAEVELRKQVKSLATAGSGPAQEMMAGIHKHAKVRRECKMP